MTAAVGLVVLAFHGGGMFTGSPEGIEPVCESARAMGAECVAVKYPLCDIDAAVRKARRVAHKYPYAVAYGESAGGWLAARLALEGRVLRAATVATPLNLVRFEHPYLPDMWERSNTSLAERERYSITTAPRRLCASTTPRRTRWCRGRSIAATCAARPV